MKVKKKLTPDEKVKRKVERFKAQNINPYPAKKITEMGAIRGSRNLISSRRAALPTEPERMIAKYLDELSVKYEREKYFKGLFSRLTGKLLFFDFFLTEYKALIEYDGPYHFSGKNIEYQRFNDSLKNEFCYKKKMPLLRITCKQHNEMYSMLENFIRTIEILHY